MKKTVIIPEGKENRSTQFSQAIRVSGGDLLFISGMMGFFPDNTAPRTLVEQANLALANLKNVVESAGGTAQDIVKVTVYVKDDYRLHRDDIRAARAKLFTGDLPVSTMIQVAGFAHPDCLFEIDAIAVLAH